MLKYPSSFLIGLVFVAQSLSLQAQTIVSNKEAPSAPLKEIIEGTHYEKLPTPVTTRDKTKVEVIELFWYGCGHCFKFDPLVNAWKSTIAADVDFYRMPAMWSPTMRVHAQAFYTAKALGIADKIHSPFFDALILKKQQLNDIDKLGKFFAGFGIDQATFEKTFKSFGVDSQVNLAESRARSYGMQGTPEIIVNGKYRVSTDKAGDQPKMLEVVNFLIAKERAAMVKK